MNINRFSGSEAIGNIYESDSAYGKHFLHISIAPTTVTGSGKRDILAQAMIFQYKRCCSKKRNIIYY